MGFNISDYLKKTLKVGDERMFLKMSVGVVLKEVLGLSLEEKEIQFKDGIVYIKKGPAFKNAIAIKKEVILKKIKEKMGNTVFDIK